LLRADRASVNLLVSGAGGRLSRSLYRARGLAASDPNKDLLRLSGNGVTLIDVRVGPDTGKRLCRDCLWQRDIHGPFSKGGAR